MLVFNRAGAQNTEATLRMALAEAKKRDMLLVVASTGGKTGMLAAHLAQESGVRMVVVTHNAGFSKPGQQEFDDIRRQEIEQQGHKVLTATLPLRSLGTAIRESMGGNTDQELVNAALRIFCQGAKVCVELAAMVADAGLVGAGEDIVAVAGTVNGADTAAVVKVMPSNKLFDIRLREFLCKPGDF